MWHWKKVPACCYVEVDDVLLVFSFELGRIPKHGRTDLQMLLLQLQYEKIQFPFLKAFCRLPGGLLRSSVEERSIKMSLVK